MRLGVVVAPGKEQEMRVSFFQEVSIMWYLVQEKNIAKLIGYCEEPLALIMKFYPLGSLDNLIHKQRERANLVDIRYTNQMMIQLAGDIARGLRAIHVAGFVHSDIKVSEVLTVVVMVVVVVVVVVIVEIR